MSEQEKAGTVQEEADRFPYGWRAVWKSIDGQAKCVYEPLTLEDALHPQEGDQYLNGIEHDRDCFYLRAALARAINGQVGMEVCHDVRVDWGVEGIKPHGPDLIVLEGVPDQWAPAEATAKLKEIGARPVLVIEVTSPSTRSNDLVSKMEEYYRVGLPHYFIVDQIPEINRRQLKMMGFRRGPGGFVSIEPDHRGWVWVEPLKIWLAAEGPRAVMYQENGERILTVVETERARRQAEARVEELQTIAEEAILARHEAERQFRDEAEARRMAEEQAKQEREARAAIEERMKALEEEMRRLRGAS